jgi:hypothetical protein
MSEEEKAAYRLPKPLETPCPSAENRREVVALLPTDE